MRSTSEADGKRSLWGRRCRRLYAVIGLSVIILLVLVILMPHALSPGKSATVVARSVKRRVEPSATTTTTLLSVSANTPIYYEGMRLPSSLPASTVAVKVPILAYHAVAELPMRGYWGKQLTLSASSFEAEINYMLGHGYTPVSLEQIYLAMAGEAKLPARPVALTFDDGYDSTYSVVLPILEAHHIRATFFVVTGNVGRPGFVTWAELRAMKAAGMAIESHTVHHMNLGTLSDAVLASELSQSRVAIMAELGQAPAALSYPGGEWNLRVAAATKAAGYLVAVLDKPSSTLCATNAYYWPRIGIGRGETLSNFAKALEGIASTGVNPVVFSWPRSHVRVTGYEVEYSMSPTGPFVSAGFTTRTFLSVDGLASGQSYYFKVRAYVTVNGVNRYAASSYMASVRVR